MSTSPRSFDWKNPQDVARWRSDRKQRLEQVWGTQEKPLLFGTSVDRPIAKPGTRQNRIAYFHQEEQPASLADRLAADDGNPRAASGESPRFYSTLHLMGTSGGEIVITPAARAADPKKKTKARLMYERGLEKKANRELACGLMGGVVSCKEGHSFAVSYECGNRYCPRCGPDRANESFAKILGRMRLTTALLLDCGDPHCKQCYWFRRGRTKREDGEQLPIPHWPPPAKGKRAQRVIAILDFMLPKAGAPDRWTARRMNAAIKKTIRTVTRRAGISRADYGYLYTDEYGARNSNLHAHGIYVGPRLDYKEIKRAWCKAIGSASAVFVIRMCEKLEPALFHAIKYPAKFGDQAAADWLAELEHAFHRVRRLHRLGRFYNMPKPEDEQEHDGRMKKCPVCSGQLSEPTFNRLLRDLTVPDLRELVREVGRKKVLLCVGLSP
jgi:hypothetical protein